MACIEWPSYGVAVAVTGQVCLARRSLLCPGSTQLQTRHNSPSHQKSAVIYDAKEGFITVYITVASVSLAHSHVPQCGICYESDRQPDTGKVFPVAEDMF